jgi:DNA-binding NarL/FixJ family response regulator
MELNLPLADNNLLAGPGYRILIGEDHPLVRVGVRKILEQAFDCIMIGEAASGPEVLAAADRAHWDLLILDLGLPERSGLDILPELKERHRTLPILVLTMHTEEQMGLRLLRAGVAGYLTKDGDSEELVEAVRRVLAGGKYISLRLAERVAEQLDTTSSRLPHESLSAREFQITCLLGEGRSITEIAAKLSLDPRTVGTYRRHILRKLHLTTTQEIVYYAIRQGLVA